MLQEATRTRRGRASPKGRSAISGPSATTSACNNASRGVLPDGMLLTRLEADGLAGGPLRIGSPDRVVATADAGRVGDAIGLLAAALDRSRLLALAADLGISGAATEVA